MSSWQTLEEARQYEISSDGRIRHRLSQRERKFSERRRDGRLTVTLKNPSGKRKSYFVHRLVMKYFGPKDLPLDFKGSDPLCVGHIDKNKKNNRIENLCVTTRSSINYWIGRVHGIKNLYDKGQPFQKGNQSWKLRKFYRTYKSA